MSIAQAWLSAGALSMLVLVSQARAQAVPPVIEAGGNPPEQGVDEPAEPTAVETDGSAREQSVEAPCTAERFIELTAKEGVEPALFNEVRTDLATELAHRGIAVCSPGVSAREAAGLVVLSADDSTVVIELDDRLTHKRVGRDLALAGLPANGRALAIAIAIDELLRASWAELNLRRKGEPEGDGETDADGAPHRTTRTVNARRPISGPVRVALGGELGFQHTAERFDGLSISARASLYPWQRGWFALGVGGVTTLPVDNRLGNVLASGVRGAFTAGVCARDQRHIFGCGGLRAEVDYLSLRGVTSELARGSVKHAAVVQLAAVGMLAVPLQGSRTLFGELSLGGVLLGAEATDGTSVIVGVTGLILALHLGLEFTL